MADSLEVRSAVIQAVSDAYLGCWSYGRGPYVTFCDANVWFHPNTVIVRGEIEFFYRSSDVFMEESFKRAARNAYDNLKSIISQALRDYAERTGDPDMAGEWIIDIEHMKTTLSEE